MNEIQFASRLLEVCTQVSGWMVGDILDRPERREPTINPDMVRSYLAQVRTKLDKIEKDFCP